MRGDRTSRSPLWTDRRRPPKAVTPLATPEAGKIAGVFDCSDFVMHNEARLVGRDPLTVVTDPRQWSYAIAFRLRRRSQGSWPPDGPCLIRVKTRVESGRIGMIFVADDLQTVAGTSAEGSGESGHSVLEVRTESVPGSGWLVIRNNAAGNTPSRCRIETVEMFEGVHAQLPFPAFVRHRSLDDEGVPAGGGDETFDTPEALALNRARLAHLDSLGLPLQNRSVLDVGCGVGHLMQFFLDRNCRVVGVDGRAENIERLRAQYPQRDVHVASCESDLSRFGQFDVVFGYGLLYHVENPAAALRNMAVVCRELLLLETIVCDYDKPVVVFDDETKTVSQALHGVGSRPSPSFMVMTLDRIGVPFVYAAKVRPDHPDFRFQWRNTLDWRRDGHLLRCVFVGARHELDNDRLVLMNPRA
jgi:SAM-dependent methyltransferase